MIKVRLDGRDYDFGSESHVGKLDDIIKALRLDAKDFVAKLAAETSRADKAEGERDGALEKLKKVNLDAEEAQKTTPLQLEKDARAKRFRRRLERAVLRFFGDDAEGDDKNEPGQDNAAADKEPDADDKDKKEKKRAFPPGAKAPPFTSKDGGDKRAFPMQMKTDALEEKLDSMSDREVMLFCLKKDNENFDATDKSDDYVLARFDTMIEEKRKDRSIGGVVRTAMRNAANLDAQEDDEVSKARHKRDQVLANAWKDGLPSAK